MPLKLLADKSDICSAKIPIHRARSKTSWKI